MHRYVYILINCFFYKYFFIIILFFIFLLLHFDIMKTLMPYPMTYTSIICNNVNHSHINKLFATM
jgi:hypothetical protein